VERLALAVFFVEFENRLRGRVLACRLQAHHALLTHPPREQDVGLERHAGKRRRGGANHGGDARPVVVGELRLRRAVEEHQRLGRVSRRQPLGDLKRVPRRGWRDDRRQPRRGALPGFLHLEVDLHRREVGRRRAKARFELGEEHGRASTGEPFALLDPVRAVGTAAGEPGVELDPSFRVGELTNQHVPPAGLGLRHGVEEEARELERLSADEEVGG